MLYAYKISHMLDSIIEDKNSYYDISYLYLLFLVAASITVVSMIVLVMLALMHMFKFQ